ncbi:MAG: hypothetical protein GY800_06075 [Planctomycetes bacterium]|nr:hypothetical protein [Planctomycetota bacterium]
MSSIEPLDLVIKINGEEISERRLNEMTVKLKGELTNLKPLTIDLQRDTNSPNGTMSVEAITVGAISLAVLPTMIPAIIMYLRDWQLRNTNRMVTIKRRKDEEEIEVSFPENMTSERLQELINSISDNIANST